MLITLDTRTAPAVATYEPIRSVVIGKNTLGKLEVQDGVEGEWLDWVVLTWMFAERRRQGDGESRFASEKDSALI